MNGYEQMLKALGLKHLRENQNSQQAIIKTLKQILEAINELTGALLTDDEDECECREIIDWKNVARTQFNKIKRLQEINQKCQFRIALLQSERDNAKETWYYFQKNRLAAWEKWYKERQTLYCEDYEDTQKYFRSDLLTYLKCGERWLKEAPHEKA